VIIALCVVAYFAVAFLCTYWAGRLTGDAVAPLWLMWPIILLIVLVSFAFEAVGELGERHNR
jgi:hypothetical protein